MSIVVTIPYVNEFIINYCIKAIEAQSKKPDEIIVINNVTPAMKAFNLCLDYGFNNNFEFIWLVNADVVMYPNALFLYLMYMTNDVFCVHGSAKDFITDTIGPGGAFLFRTSIMRDVYRFEINPYADINLIKKVSEETDYKSAHLKEDTGIHHPIYTPFELYKKIRYTIPKYPNNSLLHSQYKKFINDGFKKEPNNITLIVARDTLNMILLNPLAWLLSDNDNSLLKDEWNEFNKQYNLIGTEYYAMDGWQNNIGLLNINGLRIPEHFKRVSA